MNLLALIPARKGSKGVPGKALRTVGSVPLILRTLRAVDESGVAERVVVTTDWPELAEFCRLRGYEVLDRPAELAADDVPLAPVAKHAVTELGWEDDVAIFQPTCPLLTAQTIRECVADFRGDWAITAVPSPHIVWDGSRLLTRRVNRQELDLWRESGAIQIMSAAVALGEEPSRRDLLLLDHREGLDIDSVDDLLLAERLAARRRIHFVVAAGHEVGSGHYRRCCHLARLLSHHDLSWEWFGTPPEGWDAPAPVRSGRPDVVVFDRLAVDEDDLLMARSKGAAVVVLEDEGAASGRLADLRVNEMLDPADLRYATLREGFLCLPEREQRHEGRRILITFGGTDPAGLTSAAASELGGYELDLLRPSDRRSVATAMREADIVVTGQGRTVLEAAACGVPVVSIAANEREARHLRIPGVIYMGLWANRTRRLVDVVNDLTDSPMLRSEMAATARAAVPEGGAERLAKAIEEVRR